MARIFQPVNPSSSFFPNPHKVCVQVRCFHVPAKTPLRQGRIVRADQPLVAPCKSRWAITDRARSLVPARRAEPKPLAALPIPPRISVSPVDPLLTMQTPVAKLRNEHHLNDAVFVREHGLAATSRAKPTLTETGDEHPPIVVGRSWVPPRTEPTDRPS